MDDVYELCSIASSTETADNLPGLGRTLGLFYSFAGRKLEYALGRAAERMGYGPRVTALRIKTVAENELIPASARRKKLERYCKRLGHYTKSDVSSTQETALGHIIDLAVESKHLHEILSTTTGQTIATLCKNPYLWCNMKSPAQRRARQALATLDDLKIYWLVETISTHDSSSYAERLEVELNDCLLHEEFSFLVLRHIQRRLKVSSESELDFHRLRHFIRRSVNILADRSADIECPVLEDVIQTSLSCTSIYYSYAADFVSYPAKSPWPETISACIEDTKSSILHRRICSYKQIYGLSGLEGEPPFKAHERQLLQDFLMLTESGPDLALATICFWDASRNSSSRLLIRLAAEQLSRWIDSDSKLTRLRAKDAVGTVLSLSRYARQDMLEALASAKLSRSALYEALLVETAEMCIPKDFSCRELDVHYCEDHGVHKWTLYRHCAENGEVKHFDNAVCNGECGAVEEHALELFDDDVVSLWIKRGETFQSTGHHPLIAGYSRGGRPLYVAYTPARSETDNHMRECFAIHDGFQHGWQLTKEHHFDGSTATTGLAPYYYWIYVLALKYDPSAFGMSKHHAARGKDEGGMDPTGPFVWKFRRKLADARPRSRRLDEGASARAKDVVWVEQLWNPDVDESFEEECWEISHSGWGTGYAGMDIIYSAVQEH